MSRDYVDVNQALWNKDAPHWADLGARQWAADPNWGIWGLAEADHHLLPKDMSGMAAVELGCGTGYVASWMDGRGADVTAIDVSEAQLSTAQALAAKHGRKITFIHGNAEATGLADASFDFAISEYGASIWCKPELWLTEAARILRPNGRLVFLGNHPIATICAPRTGAPTEHVLHRPYRGMWGVDWTQVEIDPSGICFNLTIADWIALFDRLGFEIERFQELYAPEGAKGVVEYVPADWARDYPVEMVWHLKKPAP